MTYDVVGVMSGTSMDGVDLCRCLLELRVDQWHYEIRAATTYAYPAQWRQRLDEAMHLRPDQLTQIDYDYAGYLATLLKNFISDGSPPALVASHGHTIHHVPEKGYTRQIGDPQQIADLTGWTVVGDFRRGDVALGGQGAPLVPLADRVLFGEYAACVNLGGFANLSFEREGQRIAGDISVCNILSDRLAGELGSAYDDGGRQARSGMPEPALLNELDELAYFAMPMPKSLGREWFESAVWPLYSNYLSLAPDRNVALRNALATAGTQLAQQLARALRGGPAGRVLVTGGGAFNDFVLEGLRQNLPATFQVERPDATLVNYKEALAFALLGVLRTRGETNILRSVTGARRDSSGGVVAEPSKAETVTLELT